MTKAGHSALLSNSFLIFISRFFPSLASLLVMIWFSRHLPRQEYGSYQNFWVQLYVISPLACMGLHVLAVTYSPGQLAALLHRITPARFAVYWIWLAAHAALFAWLQYSRIGMPFLVPLLFFAGFSLCVVVESLLVVTRQYTPLIAINVIYSIAFVAIHWYSLRQPFSFAFVYGAVGMLLGVRLVLYAAFALPALRKHRGNEQSVPAEKVRSLWLHLGVYDVLQVLFTYVDKFVISLMLAADASAIYFNGSQNIPFLPLLIGAAGSAVLLQLSGGSRDTEHEDTVSLMNHVGRLLSCIIFPLFLFLLLYREPFMVGVFTERYRPAIPVFAMSLLVLPVRAYHFTTVLQRRHKGGVINAGAVADLVLACALMYPLYRLMGLPGVALSFVISTYLQAAFYLLYTARLMGVSPLQLLPLGNWALKMIVFATILISFRYLTIGTFTGWVGVILGGSVAMILVVTSLMIELKQAKYGNR